MQRNDPVAPQGRGWRRGWRRLRLGVAMAWCVGVVGVPGWGREPEVAAPQEEEPAEIAVDGLGWWSDRQMRLSLERLLGDERGAVLNANAVEDAVFLLMAAVAEDGYLKPTVRARMDLADGRQIEEVFDAELATLLPRPLAVRRLELEVDRGVRYFIDDVEVVGAGAALPEEDVRGSFDPEPGLLSRRQAVLYSPSRIRQRAGQFEDRLRAEGYAAARVEATTLSVDDETGAADVRVIIEPGARWMVERVRITGERPADVLLPDLAPFEGEPWNFAWQQDVREAVRLAYFEAGYPDVTVRLAEQPGPAEAGRRQVVVRVAVTPGPRVVVGAVRFEGDDHTRESVLRRRIPVEPGDPLNPLRFERARYRLGRLGVFSSVDLRYEPAAGPVRDPVFTLDESDRLEVSLLAGYGSYEQLRGGIEVRQTNLWGRAHRSRLQLIQSFRSSRGEYSYSVPELFGESLDGTVTLFGLRREERAFVREEYGGTIGLRMPVPWLGADGSIGYTFQSLRNSDNELVTRAEDNRRAIVASVDIGLSRDRRDNPLRPRRGYRWFTQLELAADALGGEVGYQRLEFGGSYHRPWGEGRWLHFGLTHGVVLTLGEEDDADLPVSRRFYPGGDASIRGYREGQAAPRGADGRFMGAKSFLLLNLEFEQALTRSWSVVAFVDALATAATLGDYPLDEDLYTVGLGVRYQTIIGPVRLEYGHNLNPRPEDPSGAVHLSIGFPF